MKYEEVSFVVYSALMPLALAGCGECKHEYDDGVAAKEATCAEAGEKIFTCTLCDETKVESIPVEAHSYKEEITKEATFKEEGVKTFTCEKCGDSYTESIPVREDEIVVSVTDKSNLPKDASAGRFSDRVELTFEILNNSDKAIKGIQGKMTICDLFGEEILGMKCDFTGHIIPAGESVTVDELGMDKNQFMDKHVKLYNTDFADLQFEYEITDIVYEDGSGTGDDASAEPAEDQKVAVTVTDKKSLEIDYQAGRFSPRVQFVFDVFNHTSKEIKGVQGVITIKDLFGVDIMSANLDLTGKAIPAGESVAFEDLGIDINQFMDEHVKVYTTEFADLQFEYEVTSIVYSDGTTE